MRPDPDEGEKRTNEIGTILPLLETVPYDAWMRLVVSGDYRAATVRQFAQEQGIAPGIVVGRLQHERLVSWSRLNGLKVRLRWRDSSSQ